MKRELEEAILLVRKTIKGHVAAMQQETAASLKVRSHAIVTRCQVPGYCEGTPIFRTK